MRSKNLNKTFMKTPSVHKSSYHMTVKKPSAVGAGPAILTQAGPASLVCESSLESYVGFKRVRKFQIIIISDQFQKSSKKSWILCIAFRFFQRTRFIAKFLCNKLFTWRISKIKCDSQMKIPSQFITFCSVCCQNQFFVKFWTNEKATNQRMLTLRRLLRKKLQMRWFFDVPEVKVRVFLNRTSLTPPSDFWGASFGKY